MDVSGLRHRALPPRKESPVPIVQETEWITERFNNFEHVNKIFAGTTNVMPKE
jgi:hypothetical protein